MLQFLQDLDVTEEERSKLASLGASSPLALLAIRKAFPQAFGTFPGSERAEEIAAKLQAGLSEEDKKSLQQSRETPHRFGARIKDAS